MLSDIKVIVEQCDRACANIKGKHNKIIVQLFPEL